MSTYLPRLVDAALQRHLRISGATLITGPRACGKTSTAKQVAASIVDLVPGTQDYNRAMLDPSSVLKGPTPRLLDEWQNQPLLWGLVRREVDARDEAGQFLLTGSAWPEDDARRHSGAGRITTLLMRTMSLYESGESSGTLSLRRLFDGTAETSAESPLGLSDVVSVLVRGGWPAQLGLEPADAQLLNRSYLEALAAREFTALSGSRRVPNQFVAFVEAYAGLAGQPASYAAVNRRIGEDGRVEPTAAFAGDMHEFARRLYLVDDLPAWSPAVRSRTVALQTPKRHFVDPSLACAALRLSVDRLLTDPETLGFLFESLVARDLRCYAASIDARGVYHYRDQKGRDEIDIVIENDAGDWIGVEVKLGWRWVSDAVANLERVSGHIKRPPAACVVIVPEGAVMRTESGVWIVPIGVLGP